MAISEQALLSVEEVHETEVGSGLPSPGVLSSSFGIGQFYLSPNNNEPVTANAWS